MVLMKRNDSLRIEWLNDFNSDLLTVFICKFLFLQGLNKDKYGVLS